MKPININDIINYYLNCANEIEKELNNEIGMMYACDINNVVPIIPLEQKRIMLENIVKNKFPNHDLDDVDPVYGLINLSYFLRILPNNTAEIFLSRFSCISNPKH